MKAIPSLVLLLAFALGPLSEVSKAEAQRFALVVGVREYPNSDRLTKLEFTETDADEMAAVLKKVGFGVTLMTQKSSQGEGNQRYNPTATYIRKQFADIVATPYLKNDDCIMVTFSGHGIQLPAKSDPKKFTFYFCPADADIATLVHAEDVQPKHNLIPVQELYDTLNQSKAGVKLLVLDACRNDPNKPSAFRSPNSVTRPTAPTPPGGMMAFFSCSENEQAVEDPTLKHGVFTYYLLEGLGGKADVNQDKQITTTELSEFVGLKVFTYVRQHYNRRQQPHMMGELRGFAPLCATPAGSPSTARSLIKLNLNGSSYDPWISSDGLAIYYSIGDSIWMATRKDTSSSFGNQKRLVLGRMPTLTADGLQMVVLRPGTLSKESLHIAERPAIDKPFSEPTEIPELRQQLVAKSPALSADGLTLFFNRQPASGQGAEIVLSTRKNANAKWSTPRPVQIIGEQNLDKNIVTWPFLTPDGETLFVIQPGGLFVGKKQNDTPTFKIVGLVPLAGDVEFTGVRCPRYVSESKELFFSGTTDRENHNNKNWSLWVLKNYDP